MENGSIENCSAAKLGNGNIWGDRHVPAFTTCDLDVVTLTNQKCDTFTYLLLYKCLRAGEGDADTLLSFMVFVLETPTCSIYFLLWIEKVCEKLIAFIPASLPYCKKCGSEAWMKTQKDLPYYNICQKTMASGLLYTSCRHTSLH